MQLQDALVKKLIKMTKGVVEACQLHKRHFMNSVSPPPSMQLLAEGSGSFPNRYLDITLQFS
jgi:hypothetical protein